MISRITEHCFWMFRYLERGEILARTLCTAHLIDLDGRKGLSNQESFLLTVSQEKILFLQIYNGKSTDHELIQHFMIWQELNNNSLLECFKSVRTNAQLIREIISEEIWRVINGLYLWMSLETTKELYMNERYAFYSRILEFIRLLKGHFYSTLLRDDYFQIMELGLHFERTQQVFNMLDKLNPSSILGTSLVNEESEEQFTLLSFLLDSFDSNESYLKEEQDFKLTSLVQFFLNNEHSPFSLTYNLKSSLKNLSCLSINEQNRFHLPEKTINKILNFLPGVKPKALLEMQTSPEKQIIRSGLNEINDSLKTLLFGSTVG